MSVYRSVLLRDFDLESNCLILRTIITSMALSKDRDSYTVGLSLFQSLFLDGNLTGRLVDRDVAVAGLLNVSHLAAAGAYTVDYLGSIQGLLLFLELAVLDLGGLAGNGQRVGSSHESNIATIRSNYLFITVVCSHKIINGV